jgi:hypothetical protein
MSDLAPLFFRMATGSMSPTIVADDFLLAVREPNRLPRRGEIWVLPPTDALAERRAHRVIRTFIRDGVPWIATRGDANGTQEDAPLRADAALARVVAVGRELGRPPRWMTPRRARFLGGWILSGKAALLDALLVRAHARLSGRPGAVARGSRRALLAAALAHEELLGGARSLALVEMLCAVRAPAADPT